MLPGESRSNLHELGHNCWVGSVLHRSCTTYDNGRLLGPGSSTADHDLLSDVYYISTQLQDVSYRVPLRFASTLKINTPWDGADFSPKKGLKINTPWDGADFCPKQSGGGHTQPKYTG